jgi:hypothetical protein
MSNPYLTPVPKIPGPDRPSVSRYRELCEDFLASEEQQVKLDWQAFAPGRSLTHVANSWRTFFSDPGRKAPAGVRFMKRGEELFLVRSGGDR